MSFEVLVATGLLHETDLVRSILEQQDFHVLPVGSVAEARRRLRFDAVDAIIVAEYLPDGGWRDLVGMETVQAASVPVIVIATGIENADRQNARAGGAFDLIARPVTSEVILTLLYGTCTMAPTGHRRYLIEDTLETEVGV